MKFGVEFHSTLTPFILHVPPNGQYGSEPLRMGWLFWKKIILSKQFWSTFHIDQWQVDTKKIQVKSNIPLITFYNLFVQFQWFFFEKNNNKKLTVKMKILIWSSQLTTDYYPIKKKKIIAYSPWLTIFQSCLGNALITAEHNVTNCWIGQSTIIVSTEIIRIV